LTKSLVAIFDINTKGENLVKVQNEYQSTLAGLGANVINIPNFFKALEVLKAALNGDSTSSESDQAKLVQIVQNYIDAANAYVMIQAPGLEDFATSKVLRDDPLNKEFYDVYDSLEAAVQKMKTDPAASSTIFNAATAEQYVRIVFLIEDFIKNAVITLNAKNVQ
jgi:hypothetical protein